MSARWSTCGIGRGLLRRHVGRRAERHAERREGAIAGRDALTALATPKSVTTAWRAGEQHVVGLDVAVDDALPWA